MIWWLQLISHWPEKRIIPFSQAFILALNHRLSWKNGCVPIYSTPIYGPKSRVDPKKTGRPDIRVPSPTCLRISLKLRPWNKSNILADFQGKITPKGHLTLLSPDFREGAHSPSLIVIYIPVVIIIDLDDAFCMVFHVRISESHRWVVRNPSHIENHTKDYIFISRGAEGPGREILQRPPPPRPSVCLCPSVSPSSLVFAL